MARSRLDSREQPDLSESPAILGFIAEYTSLRIFRISACSSRLSAMRTSTAPLAWQTSDIVSAWKYTSSSFAPARMRIRWAVPVCAVAADANGDGALNIADAIKLLGYLFGGDSMVAPNGNLIAPGAAGCKKYATGDIPPALGCGNQCGADCPDG